MTAKDWNKSTTPQKKRPLRLALGLAAPIALLTTVALKGTAAANIFTSGFENGLEGLAKETCCSHSVQTVDSPVRAGSKAAKFTYRKADFNGAGKKRSELRTKTSPMGSERWYGVSFYVPENFTMTEGPFIINQFHTKPDKGEQWGIANLFLQINDGRLKLGNRWDARKITPPRDAKGSQSWDLGPVPKKQWVDVVYHIKWSHQSDGILEVFVDGKKVVEEHRANTYNNDSGPFMKFGMYASGIRSRPNSYDFKEQTLYFDEIRIGDGSADYQDVVPASRVASGD